MKKQTRCRTIWSRRPAGWAAVFLSALPLSPASMPTLLLPSELRGDDCPPQPPLENHLGSARTVCPCFLSGEMAGAIFDAPREHYPIEVLAVGIGWSSTIGGTLDSLEDSISIFPAGLPDPGTPIATIRGPVLKDGYINEFGLPLAPVIDSGLFTVALKFANDNVGDPFSASMIHDGLGCRPNRNVVFSRDAGWVDLCPGLSGNWVIFVKYRSVECSTPLDIIRGDANADGRVNIGDVVFGLFFLFTDLVNSDCQEALDTNDDGKVSLGDCTQLLQHLFLGGPPPATPYPLCGPRSGPQVLGCASFEPCRAIR